MKIKLFITTIIALLLANNAFTQTDEKETYINDVYKFSLSYLDTWELEDAEEGLINIYSPFDQEDALASDKEVYEQMQITLSQWDDGTLDEFVEINFYSQDWINNFDNFKIKAKGTESINGNEAKWVTFTYNSNDTQITTICYFIKMNNYVMSLLGLSSTSDYDKEYKDIYMDIIHSVKSEM